MSEINRREFIHKAGVLPAAAFMMNKITGENIPSLKNEPDMTKLYDPWLEINLKNIDWNIRQIKKLINNKPILAVIKGNAYGHGLVEIGSYLEKIKVYGAAVGKLSEALELRRGGITFPVLNFGPFSEYDAETIIDYNISQTVYYDNIHSLQETAKKLNRKAKVHINIDTGMGRVGIPYYRALPFIEKVARFDHVDIRGIFTAFTEEKEFDKIQLKRFLEICIAAKSQGISLGYRHAASSAALMNFPESHLDMVRPGIAIYGHYPSDEEYKLKRIALRPAMSLKTRISCVKRLRAGDSISYHRAYTATKEEKIATASLGYSDGFPYDVAGKSYALIKGRKYPLIAAVTANHISLKVTDAKDINEGDEVVLFGKQGNGEITAEELAAAADTSVYKIVIMMNPLLPKVFME